MLPFATQQAPELKHLFKLLSELYCVDQSFDSLHACAVSIEEYKCARRTLTIIIAILMAMLLGIAYLVPAYGVAATVPGEQGCQSVLSQLLAAITGRK